MEGTWRADLRSSFDSGIEVRRHRWRSCLFISLSHLPSQKLVECHIRVQHELGFQSSHQISQASHSILGLSSKLKFSRILGLGFSEMTKYLGFCCNFLCRQRERLSQVWWWVCRFFETKTVYCPFISSKSLS